MRSRTRGSLSCQGQGSSPGLPTRFQQGPLAPATWDIPDDLGPHGQFARSIPSRWALTAVLLATESLRSLSPGGISFPATILGFRPSPSHAFSYYLFSRLPFLHFLLGFLFHLFLGFLAISFSRIFLLSRCFALERFQRRGWLNRVRGEIRRGSFVCSIVVTINVSLEI